MSDIQMVNIDGLDKAAVLATLFNASAPGGMGFLQAEFGPSIMTIEDAQQLISGRASGDLKFGYVFGRPLKVNLSSDTFHPGGFDYDNGGTGTAKRLIDDLRANGQVNSDELGVRRKQLLDKRVAQTREFVGTPTRREGNTTLMGGSDVADVVTRHQDEQVERFSREW